MFSVLLTDLLYMLLAIEMYTIIRRSTKAIFKQQMEYMMVMNCFLVAKSILF